MWLRHLLSTEPFTFSSNCLYVTDFYSSPQLLQLAQPDHLLVGQAIVGAFHFYELQGKGDDELCGCMCERNEKQFTS